MYQDDRFNILNVFCNIVRYNMNMYFIMGVNVPFLNS